MVTERKLKIPKWQKKRTKYMKKYFNSSYHAGILWIRVLHIKEAFLNMHRIFILFLGEDYECYWIVKIVHVDNISFVQIFIQ